MQYSRYIFQVGSLEKSLLERRDGQKILPHVSDYLSNGHKVAVKTRGTDIVTLILAHCTRFPGPLDVMVDFELGENCVSFDINVNISNITDPTLPRLMFFYVLTSIW